MNHAITTTLPGCSSANAAATPIQVYAYEAMPDLVPGFCLSASALRNEIDRLVGQAMAGRQEMTFMINRAPSNLRPPLERLRSQFAFLGHGLDLILDDSKPMRDWLRADLVDSSTPALFEYSTYEASPDSVPGFCVSVSELHERTAHHADGAMSGVQGCTDVIALAPIEMRPLLKRWRTLFASIGHALDSTSDDIGAALDEEWSVPA